MHLTSLGPCQPQRSQAPAPADAPSPGLPIAAWGGSKPALNPVAAPSQLLPVPLPKGGQSWRGPNTRRGSGSSGGHMRSDLPPYSQAALRPPAWGCPAQGTVTPCYDSPGTHRVQRCRGRGPSRGDPGACLHRHHSPAQQLPGCHPGPAPASPEPAPAPTAPWHSHAEPHAPGHRHLHPNGDHAQILGLQKGQTCPPPTRAGKLGTRLHAAVELRLMAEAQPQGEPWDGSCGTGPPAQPCGQRGLPSLPGQQGRSGRAQPAAPHSCGAEPPALARLGCTEPSWAKPPSKPPKSQPHRPMPPARPERGDPNGRAQNPTYTVCCPAMAPAPIPPSAGSTTRLSWHTERPRKCFQRAMLGEVQSCPPSPGNPAGTGPAAPPAPTWMGPAMWEPARHGSAATVLLPALVWAVPMSLCVLVPGHVLLFSPGSCSAPRLLPLSQCWARMSSHGIKTVGHPPCQAASRSMMGHGDVPAWCWLSRGAGWGRAA